MWDPNIILVTNKIQGTFACVRGELSSQPTLLTLQSEFHLDEEDIVPSPNKLIWNIRPASKISDLDYSLKY